MAKDATAVTETVVQDTTPTDSASVETTSPEVVNDPLGDDAFDDIDEQVAKGETESDDSDESEPEESDSDKPEPKTDETKPEESTKEGDKPLAPKSENRFQKLANENRELKEQLDRLKMQETQVATEQELLNEINPETGEYYTPQEVERIAFQQSRQQQQQYFAQQRQQLEIQQTQEAIGNEAQRITDEFPFLAEGTKDFNPELAKQYEDVLGDNLIYQLPDGRQFTANFLAQNGVNVETQATLVGATTSPYKLAKLIADSTQANAAQYKVEGQRSAERMLAQSDVVGGKSAAGTKPAGSDFDEAWDG